MTNGRPSCLPIMEQLRLRLERKYRTPSRPIGSQFHGVGMKAVVNREETAR